MKGLALVMMVKNEEHVLERSIKSCLPFVESVVLVDTGSTDATKEVAKRVCGDTPLYIYDSEWKNFGHNRTEALKYAKIHCNWALVLDADDYVAGNMDSDLDPSVSAYKINIHDCGTIYNRTIIFNSKFQWKYTGYVHEVARCESGGYNPVYESLRMIRLVEGSRSKDGEKIKYFKDAILLKEELDSGHCVDISRTTFYIAQSYKDCGLADEAVKYFKIQEAMEDSWPEERYMSCLNIIRLVSSFDDKMKYAWKAQGHSKRREVPYEIMKYCREHNHCNEQVYVLGKAYYSIVMNPTSMLRVEPNAYGWQYEDELCIHAYYVGEYENSIAFGNKALLGCPPEHVSRIKANIQFSKNRLNIA